MRPGSIPLLHRLIWGIADICAAPGVLPNFRFTMCLWCSSQLSMVEQGERRSNDVYVKMCQKYPKVLRHESVECQGSVEIEKYEFHRRLLFWSFESPLQTVSFAVDIESPRPICKLHEGFVVLLKTSLAYSWYHSMRLTRWNNLETRLCDKMCFNSFFQLSLLQELCSSLWAPMPPMSLTKPMSRKDGAS